MSLSAGQSFTHYEILGRLGAGAMGEVWRARDTRLDREVAIKVLPEELARDAEHLGRFEREARTLASLNHPGIAHVYDIDRFGSTSFIAMELVPGEDLQERLARGPLSVDGAVDVARQIAAGLEAAHEAGVVHRDLKPANVRRTPAGDVKVLDFGLAKLVAADEDRSGTLTTQDGRLLGTPTYMAPEQARGAPVDRRVDIWAFGCVLYECLAGKRAFDGGSVSDVLAAVLEGEPDLSALPAAAPLRLRELVDRCLRKDPRRRLRDIGDARVQLEEIASGDPRGDESPAGEPMAARRALGVSVAVALLAAGFWGGRWLGAEGAERTDYVAAPLTFSQHFDRDPTWSPGGEWVAFSRLDSRSLDLWLKNVSTGDEHLRRGGPGDEVAPRWSPDGQYIAVLVTDLPGTPLVLVRPHASGAGAERVLIDTQFPTLDILAQWGVMGAHPWAADGSSLLVSRVLGSGQTAVFRVGRDDGIVEQLTSPPVGSQDYYASYSPDHERIVFVRRSEGRRALMLMPSSGGEPEVLLDDGRLIGLAAFRPDGRSLVYIESSGVWEMDVDARESRQLIFARDQSSHHGEVAVSAQGRVAYSVGEHDTILTLMELDDTRRKTALTSHAGTNFHPVLSRRGEIAYDSDRTGDPEIWVRGVDGQERRLTHSAGIDNAPHWSPDGERLVFRSERDGAFKVYVCNRDGGGGRLVWNRAVSAGWMGPRWSPDGELLGCIVDEEGGSALWAVSPEGAGARRLRAGVVAFDWYLDSRRVVCTLEEGRNEQLVAIHVETGEVEELWTGPHDELEVSPDGRFVMFAMGLSHNTMGRGTLELEPPSGPGLLPTALGGPVELVRPDGPWHTHHGAWSHDMKRIVYVHDADRANIYELVERR